MSRDWYPSHWRILAVDDRGRSLHVERVPLLEWRNEMFLRSLTTNLPKTSDVCPSRLFLALLLVVWFLQEVIRVNPRRTRGEAYLLSLSLPFAIVRHFVLVHSNESTKTLRLLLFLPSQAVLFVPIAWRSSWPWSLSFSRHRLHATFAWLRIPLGISAPIH